MFERLKKAFTKAQPNSAGNAAKPEDGPGPVSEWAATQGWGFTNDAGSQGMVLDGNVGGRPWRLNIAPSSRTYIQGDELRARADLGISQDVAVLVMNRKLKDALEKQAYQIYTDSLQTSLDSSMPEEMRWLSVYDEVGWDSLPIEFWTRFSVLTDRRENAQRFIDAGLVKQLMEWPQPGPEADDPMLILLLNGKAYLRMGYKPATLPTVRHAAQLFTAACEAALREFKS